MIENLRFKLAVWLYELSRSICPRAGKETMAELYSLDAAVYEMGHPKKEPKS